MLPTPPASNSALETGHISVPGLRHLGRAFSLLDQKAQETKHSYNMEPQDVDTTPTTQPAIARNKLYCLSLCGTHESPFKRKVKASLLFNLIGRISVHEARQPIQSNKHDTLQESLGLLQTHANAALHLQQTLGSTPRHTVCVVIPEW